ncbi:hypothetical protein PENSPDRAFT_654207 [Peniophora sp. CONT]|nr:hypothetical protein PENSPDRAFT_654207 [Peniophora sp. CONT]
MDLLSTDVAKACASSRYAPLIEDASPESLCEQVFRRQRHLPAHICTRTSSRSTSRRRAPKRMSPLPQRLAQNRISSCRHLSASKDCALHIVEFGTGGQVEEPTDAYVTANSTSPTAGADTAAFPSSPIRQRCAGNSSSRNVISGTYRSRPRSSSQPSCKALVLPRVSSVVQKFEARERNDACGWQKGV